MLYFDHAATTEIYPEVLELLDQCHRAHFANPASSHLLGRNLAKKIKEFAEDFKKSIGATIDSHFYFTSSATESNNTVISGLQLISGDVVIYSKADHKSITAPVENLAKHGVDLIELVHNKDGGLAELNLDADLKVKLIVLSLVNNQSGNLLDINFLAKKLKQIYPMAHIHIDAVQGFGKIPFNVNEWIDSVSITGHKIGGPKGIAGLYLKKGHKVKPLLLGGGQQDDFRPSTEAYPLMAAFHKAMEMSIKMQSKSLEVVTDHHHLIIDSIKKTIPNAYFPFENHSPYIICFIVPKLPSDVLIRHLEMRDIYVSSISACSSKIKGFNSTLAALKIEEKFHKNVVRISLSPKQTKAEVEKFCQEFYAVWSDIAHLVK